MPVATKIIDSECKFHAIVSACSMATESDLRAILTDLNKALDDIKDSLEADGVFTHSLCIQVTGIEPEQGAFKGEGMGDELHDPWTSFCPSFWSRLVTTPTLATDLDQFLGKFRSLLELGNNTLCSPMAEGDEIQFGEPLLAHLALTHPRFISNYMEFLQLWDMDHEVEISGAILEILKAHPADADAQELRKHCLEEFAGTDLVSLL